jgi:ATP-grasp domain
MPPTRQPEPNGTRVPRVGLLFNYDWDADAFGARADRDRFDHAGSFPSNARLIGFNLDRFASRVAARARARDWRAVLSHHEQFGALAAALVAERLGLPGTAPEAVLACQHKLHTRAVLERIAPEANLDHAELDAEYGGPIPRGIVYPQFVKPVKAAFSVLARHVADHAELHRHTRFSWRELWVIRRLVEPFERIARARLPGAGSAHRMLLEEPLDAPQYNLDGYMHEGRIHLLGVVDEVMYPGTQAFMRFDYPSRLAPSVQQRAARVAEAFLREVGFTHGFFNMEFFHDPSSDRLAVIEFNPRLASQLADLYKRVDGLDAHAMSLALALGDDPRAVPRFRPRAGAASSFVFRTFDAAARVPAEPNAAQRRELGAQFPDALVFAFPKQGHSLERDFKWLGSHRYGILHLGGRDARDLRECCERACALLGWPPPYADVAREAPCKPMTPMTIKPMHASLTAVAGSLKYSTPIAAVSTVPTPDQTA